MAWLMAAGLSLAACVTDPAGAGREEIFGYWVADATDPGYAGLVQAQVPVVVSLTKGKAPGTVDLHSCQTNDDPGIDVALPLRADGSAEGGIRGERLWLKLSVVNGKLVAQGKTVKARFTRGSIADFTC